MAERSLILTEASMRMQMSIASFWLAALVLAGSSACNSSANPAGPTTGLAGVWTGTIVDGEFGTGSARLAIAQMGSGVTGTWTTTFAQPADSQAGGLSGTAVGAPVTLFLTPTVPLACESGAALSGTMSLSVTVSGNHMTGSYVVLLCTGGKNGTVDLTKA